MTNQKLRLGLVSYLKLLSKESKLEITKYVQIDSIQWSRHGARSSLPEVGHTDILTKDYLRN